MELTKDESLWIKFNECFSYMPLAAVSLLFFCLYLFNSLNQKSLDN